MKPKYVVVHHPVTDQKQQIDQAVKSINSTHQRRGFKKSKLGLHVGYHALVAYNGDIRQCRAYDEMGAHCKGQRRNYDSIGVAVLGDFRTDKLEGKQLESLVRLLKELVKTYNIPRERLGYHRMFDATICPGPNIINMFNQILDMVYNEDLAEWEVQALNWAKGAGVIVDPSHALSIGLTIKQVAWFAEILRKTVNFVKLIKK